MQVQNLKEEYREGGLVLWAAMSSGSPLGSIMDKLQTRLRGALRGNKGQRDEEEISIIQSLLSDPEKVASLLDVLARNDEYITPTNDQVFGTMYRKNSGADKRFMDNHAAA